MIEKMLVPIAPLQEQKRIVAKVDQLMALCDDLEAKLQKFQKRNDRLMEAAVV
jgi:type I restriction enzyme S subunit